MSKPPPKWKPLLLRFIDQLRIVSRDETGKPGTVGTKLKLNRAQIHVLNEVTDGMQQGIRTFFGLKGRQQGWTTFCVILDLFWLAYHPGMKGALVVDQDKTRDSFRETIRNIIGSIPPAYFGGQFAIKKGSDNKFFMAFTNGSQLDFLVAGTGSKTAWGESSGYSLVHLTEIASYGSSDGLDNFEEAMSQVNPDRLYIYESTAKGYNHWRTRWLAARSDPFAKRCVFTGWWAKEDNSITRSDARFAMYGLTPPDDRERVKIQAVQDRYGWEITEEQLAWRRYYESNEARSAASQDQNQPWVEEEAFVMSGRSYFQTRLIAQGYERLDAEGTVYRGYKFWLGEDFWAGQLEDIGNDPRYDLRKHEIEMRVWYPPAPEGRYVIGADPAGGSDEKNDRHAISVWRCYADKIVQVAEYADNLTDTRRCAWVLAYIAGAYRNCSITLELGGGYGRAVTEEFNTLRQLLRADLNRERRSPKGEDWTDFLDNARYYVYRRTDSPGSAGFVIGFQTTGDLKRQVMSEFRDSHISGAAVIYSKPLLAEMQSVNQTGDTIEAPGGQKDDRVIAAALANHTWIQEERAGLIMLGETYDVVTARESGERRNGGGVVDRIVQQYLRSVEDAPREMTPAQRWVEERFGA